MRKFSVEDEIWSEKITIKMLHNNNKALEVLYSEHIPGEVVSPFLSMNKDEAQDLVNQLYAVGIQPDQAKGSSGQLKAVQYHLEDMRKLVFK